jgi:hypothetical protein
LLDTDLRAVEVDVLPAEAAKLTGPKAGEDRRHDQRAPAGELIGACGLDDGP